MAAGVLVHGDQRGRPIPLGEQPPHDVSRPLRCDHDHVVARRRPNALVEDVEAVREEDRGVGFEIRLDLLGEHGGLHLVGDEHRDQLRTPHRVLDRRHLQPGGLGLRPRRTAFAQAHGDLDAGVAQIERMGVTLRSVADHGHLAGEQAQVAVAEDGCHSVRPFVRFVS